jgi:hypothetical protein
MRVITVDVIIMSIHYWFNFLHGKTVGKQELCRLGAIKF